MTTTREGRPVADHHPRTPDDWTDTVEPSAPSPDNERSRAADDCCSQAVKRMPARTTTARSPQNRPVPPQLTGERH